MLADILQIEMFQAATARVVEQDLDNRDLSLGEYPVTVVL